MTWPVADSTGKCRTPRSSMSSSTSEPSWSAVAVYAGADITSRKGVSPSSPAATTRLRRSRSVTMPSVPSASGTTIAVEPAVVAWRAASRTGVSGRAQHRRAGAAACRPDAVRRSTWRGVSSRCWSNGVQLADDVAHALRPGEQLAHGLLGQAVGERVLRGPEPHRRRQSGQHRRVPEHVALAEQVDRRVVDDHLDTAAPHDPDGVERRRALRHDDRAGREELDLRLRRDRLEIVGSERVEGGDGSQELRDVVHDDRSYLAAPARFCPRRCMLRSCPSS